MIKAEELYPRHAAETEDYFYGPCDYQPIINALGNILIQVDDNDYQGDSRVLLKNGGQYGLLIFGWGSCSGCDALQSCTNMSQVQDVIDSMVNNVRWFLSLDDLKKYVAAKDWELEYSYHCDETKAFITKVLEYNP